jgi:hypothetical protein
MKIKEFQEAIAKELNTLDELVQGGCKAFAEDSREVYKESDQHIQKGKIAVVVVTPDMQRNGDTPGALPAETQLLIQCSGASAVGRHNRARRGGDRHARARRLAVLLALDAADDRPTGGRVSTNQLI